MKRLSTMFLVLFFLTFSMGFVSCSESDNGSVKKQEYENVKKELDKLKTFQSQSNKVIENLKEEIKKLEIEKQRLLAQKKRLEAEIIELKIKEYEKKNKN